MLQKNVKRIRGLLFPSLRAYNSKWLRHDLMAALVVTAIAIPESLGYAVIVGLPVQAGLYCALLAPVIFAMLTSSKHLVVGADSATAALVAAGGATVAVAGTAAYGNAIAELGILTGIVLLVMAAARLGFLADLISKPVLTGFISGVGVQLLVGKLPEMLGFHAKGALLDKLGFLATHFTHANVATLILSLAVVLIAVLGWKLRWPGALIGLALATVATKLFSLKSMGIEVVGIVPAGLPTLHLPAWNIADVERLLPVAFSIALVILAQSLAVIRSSAARYEEKVRDNQDLAALGMANVASAFVGGFAINGSPPRTSAGEMAGGRSQLINVMMAGAIGLMLLAATGMFAYVPAASLAAIVFTIGIHLIKFQELRSIYYARRSEFAVAIVALCGVALLGVQRGVMIAVAISLVDRLRRQYHPHDELLVCDQKMAGWASDRVGAAKRQFDVPPGVLVYRFNDALFFENANYFLERALAVVAQAKYPVKYFVLDAGAISDIDYTAAQALTQFYNKLEADDIQLAIAHAAPKLRSLLHHYKLDDIIGAENIYPSIRSAIDNYTKLHVTSTDRIRALALPPESYVVISGAALELLGIRTTNDVDLVVNKQTYNMLRAKHWKEYVLDDGKKVLSRHGYKVMLCWMGHDLAALKRSAMLVEDIPVMGLDALVDCKKQMGRKKDLDDLKLLRALEHAGRTQPARHFKPVLSVKM